MRALLAWPVLFAALTTQVAGAQPAAPPAAGSAAPRAVATAAKPEVSVGETFTVEVRASGPAGAEFTFPPEAASEEFDLDTAPATKEPLPAGTYRYAARVFALGEVQVPPIPVRYRLADGSTGEVKTAPITLRVASLLPREESERTLVDVRGPVTVPIGRAFWIGALALATMIAAAVVWLVKRRRRAAPALAPEIPALAPDEEARRSLDALAASERLARGEHRPFYIELTAIAKRYLERRLGAPIVEMTSAEMLNHLKSSPETVDLVPGMRDLAGAADQVKFARGRGLNEEAERHLSGTRAMVEALETRLRPAVPDRDRAA